MKRRDLLARTAALAAGGALAGCIGDGDGGSPAGGSGTTTDGGQGGGQTTETETETETATPTETETETETQTETETETPGTTRIVRSSVPESEGSCGAANEASVAFGSGAVRITGTIQASNPCHVAQLAGVSYDEGSDELVVAVTVESQDGMCSQCIAGISYEATVGFEGPPPGSVTVVHESMDERTEVAGASP